MNISRTVMLALLWVTTLTLPAWAEEGRPSTLPLPWPKEPPCKQFHHALAEGQFTASWEFSGRRQPLQAPVSKGWQKLAGAKQLGTRWTQVRVAPVSPEDVFPEHQVASLKLRCQDGEGPALKLSCTRARCSLSASYPAAGAGLGEAASAAEMAAALKTTRDEDRRYSLSRELFVELLAETVRTIDATCTGQRCSKAVERLRRESVALQKSLPPPETVRGYEGSDAIRAQFDVAEEDASKLNLQCGSWPDKEGQSYEYCKINYPFGSGDDAYVTLTWSQSAVPERSVFFDLQGPPKMGKSGVNWTPSEVLLLNDAIRVQ